MQRWSPLQTNCLWDMVGQLAVKQRSGEVPWRKRLSEDWQFGPGLLDVCGAKKQKRGGCRRWASLQLKNGKGSPSPWSVEGTEFVRCLPYQLHWFLTEEDCRGSPEEPITLTPLMRIQPVSVYLALVYQQAYGSISMLVGAQFTT